MTTTVPQSLANLLVHVVFSTKDRQPFLKSPVVREEMKGYLVGTLMKIKCPSLIVRCVEDHLHCLCHLSRTSSVAELIELMKSSSSAWVKKQDSSLESFYRQSGYGAFSVSQSNVARVTQYIANQEQHHRRQTFQTEFRKFLERHQVEYDERYVWD